MKVRLTPPNPHSPHPTIAFTLPAPHSDFVLDIKTTSLMGSRAKLEDVPKLHELIVHQVRGPFLRPPLVLRSLPRYAEPSSSEAHGK